MCVDIVSEYGNNHMRYDDMPHQYGPLAIHMRIPNRYMAHDIAHLQSWVGSHTHMYAPMMTMMMMTHTIHVMVEVTEDHHTDA